MVLLTALLGLTGMATGPLGPALTTRLAGSAFTLGASLGMVAHNSGYRAGSWVSGIALGLSLGPSGPAVTGAVLVTVGLPPADPAHRGGARGRSPSGR